MITMDYTDPTGSSQAHDNHQVDGGETATKDCAAPAQSTSSAALSSQMELVRQKTKELLRPQRKVGEPPSLMRSLRFITMSSWTNILLVFIPLSWALHFSLPDTVTNKNTLVFISSFLAIIPLAHLLAFATEELSLRVGQTLGGLLNTTLGNAVEFIVAITGLVKCELRIVQASLVGTVLSNMLLVMGMCFFTGGMKYSEQGFGRVATQLNSSLMMISVIAVLLPAAFHFTSTMLTGAEELRAILAVSRGVSIILLFIYVAYLCFQLYSHKDLFDDSGEDVNNSTRYAASQRHLPNQSPGDSVSEDRSSAISEEQEEEEETPKMSSWVATMLLIIVTILIAITTGFLVDSCENVAQAGYVSKGFIGIILLPVVTNAAEHVTAITVSVKNKLNLILRVTVGSTIQVTFCVIPLIVTLAWIMGKPFTLLFDPFQSITLFFSVLVVNYVMQDGRSNWLEGFILICLYAAVAVTFWYYPGSDPSGDLSQCN